MPGNIKGITIEFKGETTKLDKALRDIQKETRAIDKELNAVNKALKFKPTSVELWRQKQDLLKRKISETEDKLQALKAAQKSMDAREVEKNSAEYQQLRRQIIEAESQLKTFKGQLKAIGQVNLRAASEQFKQMGQNLEKAGQAMRGFSMAGAVVAGMLGTLTYKASSWSDELNTMSKRYNIGTDELQKYAASAELVDVDVETIAATHRKLTKAMSGAEDETGAQADAFKALGVSVTDANGELRDSDEVWQEVIAALGEVENETERDTLAMTLMGKSAGDLNTLIEDGGKTYKATADLLRKYHLDFVDQETLDNANEFKDSIDTIKMLGSVAFQQLGTQLAGYLAPALEKVVDLVGRFAEWLSNLDPRVLTIIGAVGGLVAVLSPLLIGLGKVSFAISSILGLMATMGPAIGGIVTALGPVALAIGSVIAVGVLLYKNWDKIKANAKALWTNLKTTFTNIKTNIVNTWNNIKSSITNTVNNIKTKITSTFNSVRSTLVNIWNSIKNAASSVFNAVKNAVVNPINQAKSLITNAWNAIKRVLSGKISLPHIKLPHFSISGKFSLNPPSIPHINVSWYKEGGIFSSPTVFSGIGIGEAGPEAVVPLDKLWDKLDAIAAASGAPIVNVYGAQGQDVRALAREVERVLVQMQKQRNTANGYI